jgi:hypothetical protein|tara:strand:+ start:2035 stop:3783 length:1749 start_codon:yes stop_codon:yes gene_type:complete
MTYGGLGAVQSGQFTLTRGTSPSVAILMVYPQQGIPPITGTLTIEFGGRNIAFRDCLLDAATQQTTGTGQIIECRIKDRRWKWQNPVVSGEYNVYRDNGELDATTEKTPQQLASLCFEALGETGFDVGALPNDGRPHVFWDYSSAAQALESLAESYGCRVVLGLDDVARLCRLGEGENLPILDSIMSGGDVIDPPETPESIIVVGEPDEFQGDFALLAMGLDTDGQVKPINSLSYKPAAGWESADVDDGFANVIDEANIQARILAQRTVFRWYQWQAIHAETGGFPPDQYYGAPDVLDSSATITRTDQIEWLPYQLETKLGANGQEQRSPTIYGVFYDSHDEFDNNITFASMVALQQDSSDELHYKMVYRGQPRLDIKNRDIESGGFGIDLKNKIVMFAEPVYRDNVVATNLEYIEAELQLRIAFRVRKPDTRAYLHTEATKTLGGTSHPLVVRAPALVRRLAPRLSNDLNFSSVGYIVDTSADFIREAQLYADGAAREFQTLQAATYTYEEILPISPDGAIDQVSWSVDSSSTAKTTAMRNNDVQSYLPSYQERRQRQKTAELNEAFAQIKEFIRNNPTPS